MHARVKYEILTHLPMASDKYVTYLEEPIVIVKVKIDFRLRRNILPYFSVNSLDAWKYLMLCCRLLSFFPKLTFKKN